jgi:predicted MFS family arabinose efflux permease
VFASFTVSQDRKSWAEVAQALRARKRWSPEAEIGLFEALRARKRWSPGVGRLVEPTRSRDIRIAGHPEGVTCRVKIPYRSASRDFLLFLVAGSLVGFAGSVVDSIFNNFLSETFKLGNIQRTMLEVPRELPGFLVVVFSGLFFFLCSRRLAAVANLIAFVGMVLIAFESHNYAMTLTWLFIYSSGQHLFMPLTSGIGMELAEEKGHGRVLGDLSAASNIAAILGSFLIFVGFARLHFTFTIGFAIAAFALALASVCLFMMKPDRAVSMRTKFKLRKEYRLYYLLSILYGTRKQIFITFAPWVLVTVFGQKTQAIATLLTVGGVIGIVFKPLLGRAIDKVGERRILVWEAVVLIFVCLGYGYARSLFPVAVALYVAFACFVADQLLMSVGMARATYMKKIAVDPQDVTPTLTMGVSIDHVFSISVAVASGIVWNALGYQYVFLGGALLAVVNLFAALRVRTPLQS